MFDNPKKGAVESLDQIGLRAPAKPIAVSSELLARNLRGKIAALETQVRLYATVIDKTAPAVCAFDRQERLILCNQGYAELYRLSPGQLRPGMTLTQIEELRVAARTSTAPDFDAYLAWVRSVASGSGWRAWIAHLSDGRTIEIRRQPLSDGGWLATHHDCADMQALRAAENERSALQALIDMTPAYLWVKDLEGHFVVVNKALASDSGFSKTSDLIGLSDFAIHEPAKAAEFHALEQEIIRSGRPMINREESVVDASGVQRRLLSTKTPLQNDRSEIIGLVGIAHDISERMRVKGDLRRAQEFLHLVIENIPEAIIVKDAQTRRYTMINYAAEELVGMSRADVIGKTAEAIYPDGYVDLVRQEDDELLRKGELFIDDHKIYFHEKDPRIVTLTRKLLRDDKGAPQFMLAVIHDITERKRAEERIRYLARHDSLTGLPNRSVFNERLASAIGRADVSGTRFAVLGVDLDRLKEVNDIFGHAAGDQLLREVSCRLVGAAGEALIARIGGDEFALITEDARAISNIVALTDRLLSAVGDEQDIEGAKVHASVSIGAAIFPDDGRDGTTLLANADAALYRAKAEGRGVTRFFERDMDKRLRDRRALRHDLSSAIERDEFTIVYQPKAKLTREIVGFEALLRWRHPVWGSVPPSEFIPTAEGSKVIVAIGEWVLRNVCREAASWPHPLGVAVNLSPVQFQHGDLPRFVHGVLMETGLAANRLELEITEGALIADSSRALFALRQLKALGVRIAMDDFGKGYSSLSYLRLFPFDRIKIDREFISNVHQNRQSAAIVRAVLGLARGLGMPVLAEGLESEDELAFLAAEACDEVQGYLIGRPLPIEHYAEVIGRPSQSAELRRMRE